MKYTAHSNILYQYLDIYFNLHRVPLCPQVTVDERSFEAKKYVDAVYLYLGLTAHV